MGSGKHGAEDDTGGGAPLPAKWRAAEAALAACLEATDHSFPAMYEAALVALEECANTDERGTWPKGAALASYGRKPDDYLERLARRATARLRALRGACEGTGAGR